jgi:hypothetical protein
MAEEFRYKLIIESTATGTGAEQTVKALDAVENAARDAAATQSRSASEMAAMTDKARVSEFAFYDLDKALRRTNETTETFTRGAKTQTAGMQNLSTMFQQVGYQVTDFALQTQMGTSAITAFAQQAPQAIGAITQFGQGLKFSWDAAIGLGTGVGIIATALSVASTVAVREWGKMEAAQKRASDSAEQYKRNLETMAQRQKDLNNLTRLEFITQFYREGAEYLERQAAALDRINGVRAAQGSTELAQAQAAVQQALNTGGNVTAARANVIEVGALNDIDSAESQLAAAEAKTVAAAQELEKANTVMAETGRQFGEFSDQYIQASEAFRKAQEADSEAKLDLGAQQQKFELAKQAILATAGTAIDTLQAETQTQLTEQAETVRQELQNKAAEMGGNISSSMREGLAGLEKILADGVIQPDEMIRLQEAMDRVRVSREGADQRIMNGMNSLSLITETLVQALPAVEERIKRLEGAVRQLGQQ